MSLYSQNRIYAFSEEAFNEQNKVIPIDAVSSTNNNKNPESKINYHQKYGIAPKDEQDKKEQEEADKEMQKYRERSKNDNRDFADHLEEELQNN